MLPNGLVRIGFNARIRALSAAQLYFEEPVRILAVWVTENDLEARRLIRAQLKAFRVRDALYKLTGVQVLLELNCILGPPTERNVVQRPRGRPKKGSKVHDLL